MGIELASRLKLKEIPFIFLTGFNNELTFEEAKKTLPYALLEKPFEEQKILKTIELALLQAAKSNLALRLKMYLEEFYFFNDEIFIKTGYQLQKVPISGIIFVHTEGNYCVFQTATRKHAMKISLKKIEAQFPSHDFIHVHQRYFVQKHKILKVDLSENEIILENERIPIGRKYKKILLSRLKML